MISVLCFQVDLLALAPAEPVELKPVAVRKAENAEAPALAPAAAAVAAAPAAAAADVKAVDLPAPEPVRKPVPRQNRVARKLAPPPDYGSLGTCSSYVTCLRAADEVLRLSKKVREDRKSTRLNSSHT